MNIRKIDRNFAELNNQMKKKSELMKLIEEKNAQFTAEPEVLLKIIIDMNYKD